MSMSLPRGVLARLKNPVFIETGTFDGRGAMMAHELGFGTVHTIELDPGRAATSRHNLGRIRTITVHEGDTVDVLPRILASLEDRATIFLDAHPVGEADGCKIGQYRHPLLRELDLVKQFSKRNDHTLIVDDRHDFPVYGTTDDEITEKILEINPKYRVSIEADVIIGEVL